MPLCSVVIPTHNNEDVLSAMWQALTTQVVPKGWDVEVIVVDDGSQDTTAALARSFSVPIGWKYQVSVQAHAGSAVARNIGIERARGDIIIFLGADILLRPEALLCHLDFHMKHPSGNDAALGMVTWDPRLEPTPFMEWMTHGGPQNNFDAIVGQRTVDPEDYFYGSHLSLKRALVTQEKFSPHFQGYGWEDLELGRRLGARGVRLHVLLGARALHHHRYTVKKICDRQEHAGRGLHIYQELHPKAALLPLLSMRAKVKYFVGWYSGGVLLLRMFLNYFGDYWAFPRFFNVLTRFYFWRGLLKGAKKI